MADAATITKIDKSFMADDGQKRGPMTMCRLRFHPTERCLLAQIVDRRLAWFDLDATPTEKPKTKGKHVFGELACAHEIGWVRGFAVHPQGDAVITGGSDRTLRRWEWRDGRPAETPSHQVAAHDGWVEAVAYSPDGKLVVTVGADKRVKVWDSADLKSRASLPGHERYVLDVVFTQDGHHFVTGGEDGKIIVWEVASLQSVATLDFGNANNQFGQTPRHSGVHRLAISHDDRWLATAGAEVVNVYDLSARALVASEKCAMDVACHPTAPVLVGGESEVKVWRYEADKLVPTVQDRKGSLQKAGPIPGKAMATIKRGDWSLGIAFSADGQLIAFGKSDGTVELYDVA